MSKLKLRDRIVVSIVLFLGIIILAVGQFLQMISPASATATGIPPQLKKLASKSYLLTWTDDSVVYVSCYPTIKPQMKPAPIQQTPNRYVVTCKPESF